MLRLIGGILVLLSATGLGYCKTRQYYAGLNQLREFRRGMDLVYCQMNYTLHSVPKLLTLVSDQLKAPISTYFQHLASAISQGIPRLKAYETAIQNTKKLNLPNDGLMALIEWSLTLGQFDPEGENRMMKLCIERMELALQNFQEEKAKMAKSYTLLGACAGLALIILVL